MFNSHRGQANFSACLVGNSKLHNHIIKLPELFAVLLTFKLLTFLLKYKLFGSANQEVADYQSSFD